MTQWSMSEMDAAKRSYEFIFVSKEGNSRTNMTEATKKWTADPSIVYQTGYRIAGTPTDIHNELIELGVTQKDIDDLFASSIKFDNYQTTMNTLYQQELIGYKNFRRAVWQSALEAPGTSLKTLVQNYNPGLFTEKKGKGRAKAHTDLAERIADLKPGKVLDVTELQPNGVGARAINPPTVRSKKFGSPNLPIVSSNFEHYVMAIRMLPGGEDQYYNDINTVYKIFYPNAGDWQATTVLPTTIIQAAQPDMGRVAPLTFEPTGVAPTPIWRKKVKEQPQTLAQIVNEDDLFDFSQGVRKSDYLLLSSFYSGLELLLRAYTLSNYRSMLAEPDKIKLNSELEMIVKQNNKEYLDTLLNLVEIEDMLEAWYRHYNPAKIGEIQLMLQKYVTCEDVLFYRLYKKYVDPNAVYNRLWFSTCTRPGIENYVAPEDLEEEVEEEEAVEESETDD